MYEVQKYEEGNGVGQLDRETREPDLAIEVSEDNRAHPGITLLEERDQQRQQLRNRLRELSQEIKASEGFRIRSEMSLLKKNYLVFDGNYLNLKHILEEFEQSPVFLKLWDQKDRGKLDLFINEVIRYLHNYLAGAATLLDRMRAFVDASQQGDGFGEEYQRRMDQQINNPPLSRFVKDLRDYMLHKELPFALA